MEPRCLTELEKDQLVFRVFKEILAFKDFFIHSDSKCKSALRDAARQVECDLSPEELEEMLVQLKKYLERSR